MTSIPAKVSLNSGPLQGGSHGTCIPLSEAKARLSQLIADIEKGEEELVITRNGRPAAVLISADEFASWQETTEIRRNPALMREIKRGLSQLKKGQRFTFEEVFGEPLTNT